VAKFKTVLCPVDFSQLSERELHLAVQICRRYGARLIIEHNLDPRPPNYMAVTWMWSESHEGREEDKAAAAQRQLRELLDRLPHDLPREAKLTRGPIDQGLLLLARELPADLIVMGSHGWSTPEHRSLTEQVIVGAPCPVLTLTEGCRDSSLFASEPDAAGEQVPVVVPVDFSRHSLAAMEQAFEMAAELPWRCSLLYVEGRETSGGEAESGRARQRERLEKAKERLRALVPDALTGRVDLRAVAGVPTDEIVELARRVQAALVFMGTHHKGMLRRLLGGSTSCEVLHKSPCPVWFIPRGGKANGRRKGAAA
jgi:universal stress protein A